MPIERAHISLRRFNNGGWDKYGVLTNAEGKYTIKHSGRNLSGYAGPPGLRATAGGDAQHGGAQGGREEGRFQSKTCPGGSDLETRATAPQSCGTWRAGPTGRTRSNRWRPGHINCWWWMRET